MGTVAKWKMENGDSEQFIGLQKLLTVPIFSIFHFPFSRPPNFPYYCGGPDAITESDP